MDKSQALHSLTSIFHEKDITNMDSNKSIDEFEKEKREVV